MRDSNPFLSFWQAGYEGADHRNAAGRPVDMNLAVGHDRRCAADFDLLDTFAIRTIRESVGWRRSTRHGRIALRAAVARARAARARDIQIAWTLCHYGVPDDLTAAEFVRRFVEFCVTAAEALLPHQVGAPVFTCVNEISFLAWGLDTGQQFDARAFAGHDAKRVMLDATLAAQAALARCAPAARFVQVEPMIHVVPPPGRPDLIEACVRQCESQFEVWDALHAAGVLDLVGVNHYHASQWELGSEKRLAWHLGDPRRKPLGDLLTEAWRRYQRPLVLSETSHIGSGRGDWLLDIAGEVARARAEDVPVLGVCLYPVIDRPDWERPSHWHKSGLWDLEVATSAGALRPPRRTLDRLYAADLRRAQAHVAGHSSRLLPRREDASLRALLLLSPWRWDELPAGPRSVLTRIARRQPVVVVEPASPSDDPSALRQATPAPNVRLLTPRMSLDGVASAEARRARVGEFVRDFLRTEALRVGAVWHFESTTREELTHSRGARFVKDYARRWVGPCAQRRGQARAARLAMRLAAALTASRDGG
ncbi:MAG: hypothetical protein K2Y51_06480 [Gammaproteobacteria bacterium]|nr:hypothetical protein [Gammaproteobacteria bacterium]